MQTTKWNGDMSLLRDTDISSMTIDFEDQTVSIKIRDLDFSVRTGYRKKFASISTFGYGARALRKSIAIAFASGH